MTLRIGVCVVLAVLLAGCARVDVVRRLQDWPAGETVNGVHFRRQHPYLLVTEGDVDATDPTKGVAYKTQIVYLPEGEFVATVRPGWGTIDGSLSMDTTGALSQFGAVSDSKIPETITAISGLISTGLAASPKHVELANQNLLPPGLYRAVYDPTGQVIDHFDQIKITTAK